MFNFHPNEHTYYTFAHQDVLLTDLNDLHLIFMHISHHFKSRPLTWRKKQLEMKDERGERFIMAALGLSVHSVKLLHVHSMWFIIIKKNLIRDVTIYHNPCSINTGMPQGSVLGPLLFITHPLTLDHIFHKFGIYFHCYADNNQL